MSTSSFPSPRHAPPSLCSPGSSILIDGHPLTEEQAHLGTDKELTEGGRSRVTIALLPDNTLLEIFEFYMNESQDTAHLDIYNFYTKKYQMVARMEAWRTLVHVCRHWRIVIFGSPRRLDLQLLCTNWTRITKMLDVWPPLPIVVSNICGDDILAALKHNDYISELYLYFTHNFSWKEVLSALQQPFPALKSFQLQIWPIATRIDDAAPIPPVDPDLFLGGSLSCLQRLGLCRIPIPGLSKLLSSATQLVDLELQDIPHSGYFSPETMATCLSVLTRLKTLEIGFEDPQSRPDQNDRRPPPQTRTLLPVLTKLRLQGVGEYLEDFVARIDAPLLDNFHVTFFYQPILNTPQLTQFINRTPKLKAHDQARVVFDPDEERPGLEDVWVTIPQKFGGKLRLQITRSPSDQLLSLAQLCSLSVPRALISAVEHLYIIEGLMWRFGGFIENGPVQLLELLRPFTAVKNLYICREYSPRLVLALQQLVGERVTEVLPTLQTLFVEMTESHPSLEPVQEAIGQFVAARQLVGQSIALSRWKGIKDVWDEVDEVYCMSWDEMGWESDVMED